MGLGKRFLVILATGIIAAAVFYGCGEIRAEAKPLLYFKGIPANVVPGDEFMATLALSGVSDLYGFQIEFSFDSTMLEALDANEELPGINAAPRVTLSRMGGNEAYNGAEVEGVVFENGVVKYTALNDEAIPGNVDLADIYFRAKKEGQTELIFKRSVYPQLRVCVYYDDGGRMVRVEPCGIWALPKLCV